jgi:hypothetical protein
MFAVRFLLVFFSILLLTNGVADNLNEEISTTPSDQAYIAGWYWKNPKTAVSPSKNNTESTSTASSSTPTNSSSTKTKDYRSILEFKAGYFFFTDEKMRKVFDQGGLDLQLCGSTPVWRWLQIYGSVEYLQKSGRSIHGRQKTRLWEVPISLGLEAVAKISKKFQYYFTIGPRYIFVHVHNRSHFVDKTLNENGLGGFANTGFHYFPSPHLVLDIFGEYSYARMHFHAHKKHVKGESRQVGGLVFGGGIGYVF